MGKLHDTYRLTITTLSPLHIGTGNTLIEGYDYVLGPKNDTRAWVLDQDILAETLFRRSEQLSSGDISTEGGDLRSLLADRLNKLNKRRPTPFCRMVDGESADELLEEDDYGKDSPLFRYKIKSDERTSVDRIREQIKDCHDRPYIPGSSLKGALRTAVAYVGWQERKLDFDPSELDDSPESAGQPLERRVLNGRSSDPSKAPNYDILRALQVGDSAPDDQQRLQLFTVRVVTGSKKSGPAIGLEAIPPGVTFTATLTVDGFLQRSYVAQTLGWSADDQLKWLRVIPQVVNAFTRHRIDGERIRWGTSGGPIQSFYETLYRQLGQLDKRSEFLLQLGWGGGWDSKTFGDILTRDGQVFEKVVEKYGKTMVRQGKYKAGDTYPKSRRVVVNSSEQPECPLGWIKVKMESV